jgi:hypothetical protein
MCLSGTHPESRLGQVTPAHTRGHQVAEAEERRAKRNAVIVLPAQESRDDHVGAKGEKSDAPLRRSGQTHGRLCPPGCPRAVEPARGLSGYD